MVEICEARVELVDADALLVPVDGQICRLGGASAAALRAFADGLTAASSSVRVRWSLPDPAHRALAGEALQRLR